MKKIITTLSIASIVSIGLYSSAYTFIMGVEPPASYMNNLRNCTKSTVKTDGATVDEYTIKGLLPDGKCEVEHSNYTNFADPQVYSGFVGFTKALGGDKLKDSDIPTQAQMIEQGKKEKFVQICRFTNEQRKALHAAYLKQDNGKACKTMPDGSQKCTFSTDSMSSYDKLMLEYADSCEDIQ